MEKLKTQLQEEVIEPLHHPEEYKRYGVTIPNGMLLYGPPGCGKTFFAKHFAEEVGFNFMCITPATLKCRYVNATQENIAKMFRDAEEKAPTIIFIDEINELVPNRESGVHEMSISAVNEMLAQMDRTGERGIFIIGATNYPHTIDPAIYNPQNEMFRCFRTKCSISQNEMYLRESFSLSHQSNKKAPKELTSPVLFYCLLIWLSRKKSLTLQQIKELLYSATKPLQGCYNGILLCR